MVSGSYIDEAVKNHPARHAIDDSVRLRALAIADSGLPATRCLDLALVFLGPTGEAQSATQRIFERTFGRQPSVRETNAYISAMRPPTVHDLCDISDMATGDHEAKLKAAQSLFRRHAGADEWESGLEVPEPAALEALINIFCRRELIPPVPEALQVAFYATSRNLDVLDRAADKLGIRDRAPSESIQEFFLDLYARCGMDPTTAIAASKNLCPE